MRYRITRRGKAVIIAFIIGIIISICISFMGNNPESFNVHHASTEITTESSMVSTTVTTTVPSAKVSAVSRERISGCSAALLYCLEIDEILYSQDVGKLIAPASLTKLLTACTVLKHMSPDTILTVGSEQLLVQPESSLCYINQGQQLTVEQLITGMIMASGNDAAYTLAVNTARKCFPDMYMTDYQASERFCELMNDFASELGMKNSHFVNPDGWDNNKQFTTAYDLCILARYAMTLPEIREAGSCCEKNITISSGEVFTWHNSNKLLDPSSEFYSKNVTGLKTGSTVNAGNCLISVFEKNGLTYISIIIGCEADYERYEKTHFLIDTYT